MHIQKSIIHKKQLFLLRNNTDDSSWITLILLTTLWSHTRTNLTSREAKAQIYKRPQSVKSRQKPSTPWLWNMCSQPQLFTLFPRHVKSEAKFKRPLMTLSTSMRSSILSQGVHSIVHLWIGSRIQLWTLLLSHIPSLILFLELLQSVYVVWASVHWSHRKWEGSYAVLRFYCVQATRLDM